MKKVFVGMGEALWDILPEGPRIGGAPANFVWHAGQFGFESVAVSAVGVDILGDDIVRTFDGMGLRHCLGRVGFPTGTVQVTLDINGIPTYDICEGVAWDHIPWSAELETLAARTDVFCFGSLAQRNEVSRDSIRRFLQHMPVRKESLRVFDINLRQRFYSRDVILESLEACNILKMNDEELEILSAMFGLSGTFDDRTLELFRKFGLRCLIVTCGARDSHVFTEEVHSVIETPQVAVRDTVGAGDSFCAALCAALCAGMEVREAHRLAVDVSAWVCTQPGAMPTLPDTLISRIRWLRGV